MILLGSELHKSRESMLNILQFGLRVFLMTCQIQTFKDSHTQAHTQNYIRKQTQNAILSYWTIVCHGVNLEMFSDKIFRQGAIELSQWRQGTQFQPDVGLISAVHISKVRMFTTEMKTISLWILK